MLWKLFLAFTIIPVSEIYILIAIGGQIGILPSIGLVILTGIIGASLARSQGLQTLGRIRDSFQQGVVPGEELLNQQSLSCFSNGKPFRCCSATNSKVITRRYASSCNGFSTWTECGI